MDQDIIFLQDNIDIGTNVLFEGLRPTRRPQTVKQNEKRKTKS